MNLLCDNEEPFLSCITQPWVFARYIYTQGSELFNILLVAVPLILLLEYLLPAKPSQKLLGIAVSQDIIYFILTEFFQFAVIGWYVHVLTTFHQQHLNFLTISEMAKRPAPIMFALAVLTVDFLQWFHHWLRHKVPWFWEFHKIHHSQTRLNLFTDFRYHIVEYLVATPINVLPMLILGLKTPDILLFVIFSRAYTRFYHANIKMNLGPLRYILVTPQSHRIHHSMEPEHRDLNFGVYFSFWDRLFGTQCKDNETYPETGIPDGDFPLESAAKWFGLAQSTLAQFAYPFGVIGRSLASRRTTTS